MRLGKAPEPKNTTEIFWDKMPFLRESYKQIARFEPLAKRLPVIATLWLGVTILGLMLDAGPSALDMGSMGSFGIIPVLPCFIALAVVAAFFTVCVVIDVIAGFADDLHTAIGKLQAIILMLVIMSAACGLIVVAMLTGHHAASKLLV